MKRDISIFISSAEKELECEREIAQQALVELNINPVLFELLPAMSQSPVPAYLDEVRDCDIFILLLWKSFREAVAQEYEEAVKTDKPILVFIKTLTDDEEREEKLKLFIKDIRGVTYDVSRLSKKTVFKDFRRLSELKVAIREGVSMELLKYYKDPIYTQSKEEMYELGASIVEQSQRRIYVFQQTPSLILGPRDYLSDDLRKIPYEKLFYDSLMRWIDVNKAGTGKEFLYFFSASVFKKEVRDRKLFSHKEYLNGLKERVRVLSDVETSTNRRFRFSGVSIPFSGPLIIGDNRYAIWILGDETAVSISQEDKMFCNTVSRMLRVHSQTSINILDLLKDPKWVTDSI